MVKPRFTVEAYRKAYEAGALPELVELLEGEIYAVSPMGKRHRLYAMHLDRLFQKALGREAVVMVQRPLPPSETSEPVPDLVLLRPPLEAYRERDPGPEDALLVVEVAETTLVQDRALKLPLYQKAGIPEVWIVNLPEEALESYAFPHHLPERHPKGEEVAPKAFPGKKLPWWV